MAYGYVLRSQKTGKKYIGSTSRTPEDRLKEHNAGIVPFTNRERPYELIHAEYFDDIEIARKRENFFKSGKGRKILASLLNENLFPRHSGLGAYAKDVVAGTPIPGSIFLKIR